MLCRVVFIIQIKIWNLHSFALEFFFNLKISRIPFTVNNNTTAVAFIHYVSFNNSKMYFWSFWCVLNSIIHIKHIWYVLVLVLCVCIVYLLNMHSLCAITLITKYLNEQHALHQPHGNNKRCAHICPTWIDKIFSILCLIFLCVWISGNYLWLHVYVRSSRFDTFKQQKL